MQGMWETLLVLTWLPRKCSHQLCFVLMYQCITDRDIVSLLWYQIIVQGDKLSGMLFVLKRDYTIWWKVYLITAQLHAQFSVCQYWTKHL